MRKKTISHIADTISWYLIYFLPVILFLFYLISCGSAEFLNFSDFLSTNGFSFVVDNILVSNLSSLFGSNGILPIFNTDLIFIILTWFIGSYLCHLAVDFLLFIPRLCHKWLKKLTSGD